MHDYPQAPMRRHGGMFLVNPWLAHKDVPATPNRRGDARGPRVTIVTLSCSTRRAAVANVECVLLQGTFRMQPIQLVHSLCLVFALAAAVSNADAFAAAPSPTVVTATDMHLDRLRPATLSYLVYFHGAPGTGVTRAMLATTDVRRTQVDGTDAWTIEQHWEDETGVVHTARTVHAARDIATLAQTARWNRPGSQVTTTVVPAEGSGTVEGTLSPEARTRTETGFATMDDGWWLNWHSDLVLLPLLPYERGGTLRVHLFDVGMPAPKDVDYTVLGDRTLVGGDGSRIDCWLVQTDSGSPGTGNYQRFWIDKARRLVVKEEDVFNGQYRSKILLAVPAVTEFAIPAKP